MQTDLIVEIDESGDIGVVAIVLRTDIATAWFFIFKIEILEIFVIETDIRCVVGSLTGISLLLFLLCQFFGFVYLLLRIMRVIWKIPKCVIHIHTLMVEQLGKRHHSSVLKIFPEASCNQMHVNPGYILRCEYLHIEMLRIFAGNIDELLLLCNHSFPLFKN